jgi:hypothetical protein
LLKERPFGEEVVMTTGHAPHIPPLWRKFLSLPHTPLGQWAIGLTAGSGLLLILVLFLNSLPGEEVIWRNLIPWTAGILVGAVLGLIALLRSPQPAPPMPLSRRVLFVWLAWVPIALVAALPLAFLAMFLVHIVRHNASIASTVLFLVAMMAVIAALHFLQRHSERYGLGGTISSAASFVGFALILVGSLIGYVSQEGLLARQLIGGGFMVSTIGLAALANFTLMARVVPWWGGAALVAANPFLVIIFLFITYPPGNFTTGGFLTLWLVPVPMLVVGIAVLLAARRRNERPARVR